MPLEAVLVDAGGTLVLPDHQTVVDALRSIGLVVDPGRLDRAHYAGMSAFDELARDDVPAAGALSSARTYRSAYALEAGVPAARLDDAVELLGRLAATTGHWTRPIPGARDALEALRSAGLMIVIVSNTERGDAAAQIEHAGVCQVGPGAGVPIMAVIDSAVIGRAKPDPAIFEEALAVAGVSPAAAVHVGDSLLADVRGAAGIGIEPIHVDPLEWCPDRAHRHVRSIADLPDLLGIGGRDTSESMRDA